MTDKKLPVKEILILSVGELLAAGAIMLGYLFLEAAGIAEFDYSVACGALLGAFVSVANFLFLCFSVSRAVSEFLELRGDKEMTEEEAEKFASENSAGVTRATQVSQIIRFVSLGAVLVVSILTEWFDPIASLIPLLLYKPIITWGNYLFSMISMKNANKSSQNPAESISEDDNAEKEELSVSDDERACAGESEEEDSQNDSGDFANADKNEDEECG